MSFVPKSISVRRVGRKFPNARSLLAVARTAGPYVAIALFLPGGMVIALLALLYRRGT